MSAQRLNDKKTLKWGEALNLPIIRMWGYGGYTHAFVTEDHRHGWVDTKTGEHGFDDNPLHYTSCAELFGSAESSPMSEAVVYVVVETVDYGEERVLGVYASRERAEAAANPDCVIQEHRVQG